MFRLDHIKSRRSRRPRAGPQRKESRSCKPPSTPPGAVTAFAETVLPPLYRFCLPRVGRNRHLCEEVVQETLVRAIRDLECYDPARSGGNVFPWLTGLARNEIQRVLGREKNAAALQELWARVDREVLGLFAQLDSEPLAEDVLIREETCELVNATMAQLPPHYRDALEAKYVEGKSVRDLAAVWSMTEKAVESQLSRARQAFRATFLALSRNLKTEPTF
jgi:RNA polymerase sigma-70 factor (ECF subfamily)